jgi:hypothetical protein
LERQIISQADFTYYDRDLGENIKPELATDPCESGNVEGGMGHEPVKVA